MVDALGAPVEFDRHDEIVQRFEPDGIRCYVPAYASGVHSKTNGGYHRRFKTRAETVQVITEYIEIFYRLPMGIYNAEISAGSLMLPESRRIARLLLQHPTEAQWDAALKDENLLQKKPATARRQARLIRNRLEKLDAEGLQLIVDGDGEVACQILLVASIRHSRLLADFLRDVYGQDLRKLENALSHRQWESFFEERAYLDEAVAGWAVTTRDKLFQVIVRILAEAKFLDSTRKMGLTPPLLHPSVVSYLKRADDSETLACMEFRR